MLLQIISPEGQVFSGEVDEVTLPSSTGEITILPNHMPLFCKIGEGEIRMSGPQGKTNLAVCGGFLEVTTNKVSILADFAARCETIQLKEAQEARQRAETALKGKQDHRNVILAEKQLKKAILELKIAQKYKKKR
ncbi:MAG: ATP synthase F1 subunit epsilon [Endomicrobiales bacterium]|nr:ATP synthase F1 subunit epsilon [Endomicrobiales bacterium]